MFICARLSTWNTPTNVALAQHVVNLRILARDRRQIEPLAVMRVDQVKALRMQVSMPSASTSTLRMPQRVDVVLVPFDEAAVGHRTVADRHGLRQRRLRQDEPADMLAEMARHADHLVGQPEVRAHERIVQVQPRVGGLLSRQPRARSCPRWSERVPPVTSSLSPIDLAHLADRACAGGNG